MEEMEERFRKLLLKKDEIRSEEKKHYEVLHRIEAEKKSIVSEIIENKLNELGIKILDKVKSKRNENAKAFLIGVTFTQRPHTYTNETIEYKDYRFTGEFRAIKKDGTISKKEPKFISCDLDLIEKA
ncbi:MAG: hypothetical protein U9N33_08205 [Campylobacterota bacterium]|nr:hypothetical protein [Campylobacterota bacterium]